MCIYFRRSLKWGRKGFDVKKKIRLCKQRMIVGLFNIYQKSTAKVVRNVIASLRGFVAEVKAGIATLSAPAMSFAA